MITLTYGYLLPEDQDIGDELFDAFENNINLMNSHTHNGVNGAKISSSDIDKLTQDILAVNWASDSNGLYRQLVTIIGGRFYDDLSPEYRRLSDLVRAELVDEKVSATSFYVYTNNPAESYQIRYL